MLLRLITRSLVKRKWRLALAATAVMLAATMVASFSTLALETGDKASRELEAYGANMLLVPETISLPAGTGRLASGQMMTQGYIPAADLKVLEGRADVKAWAPYLYAVAEAGDSRVVIAGTSLDKVRDLTSHWKIEGRWAAGTGKAREAMVGVNVARKLAVKPGDRLSLEFERDTAIFEVAGIIEAGASEDDQVVLELVPAQELSGRNGEIDLVQIRAAGKGQALTRVAEDLKQQMPGISSRVVEQIAGADERVLWKLQMMMGLIASLVLVSAALTVFSTVSASVLERTKEVGLMKALGARNGQIATLFMAEAWSTAFLGALAGVPLGFGLARLIGARVFNSSLSLNPVIVPITLGVALLVTTAASLWPVRKATAVRPVIALRGE